MATAATLLPKHHEQFEALGLHVTAPPENIRNPLYPYALASDEEYVLDPKVDKLHMGLGWDEGVDVDASAALFSSDKKVVDLVWWRKYTSNCKSVRHSGDDRTGAGAGYDETIAIDLSFVPWNVHYILFPVCIYTYNCTFDKVRRAFVDMMHGSSRHRGKVMCSYRLSEMRGNAMLMGMLVRRGAYWNFKPLGLPATGRTVEELVKDRKNLECLYQTYSFAPALRRVQVHVRSGEGLLALDPATFWKAATSDPYYVIKFKTTKYKSEYVSKTLEPTWKPATVDLGVMTEAEPAWLDISLYDYDHISEDDFMGSVAIPGSMLYNCGVGTHEYDFELGPTKQHRFHRDTKFGKIHIVLYITDV